MNKQRAGKNRPKSVSLSALSKKEEDMKHTLMNYCLPEDLEQYLSFYGYHFNKKLYEYAVSEMKKVDRMTGKEEKVNPVLIDELEKALSRYKVDIPSECLYDAAYLASMVDADFFGSSIEDDKHMMLYIKDVLCDPDGYDGIVFCRYLAVCSAKGCVIFWDRML